MAVSNGVKVSVVAVAVLGILLVTCVGGVFMLAAQKRMETERRLGSSKSPSAPAIVPAESSTEEDLRTLLQTISVGAITPRSATPLSAAEQLVATRKAITKLIELSHGSSNVAAMSTRVLRYASDIDGVDKARGDVVEKSLMPAARSGLESAQAFKNEDYLTGVGALLNVLGEINKLEQYRSQLSELHTQIVAVRLEAAIDLFGHYSRYSPAANLLIAFAESKTSAQSAPNDVITITNGTPAKLTDTVFYVRLHGSDENDVFANTFYAKDWMPGESIRLVCRSASPRETARNVRKITVRTMAREEAFETVTWTSPKK